MAINAGYPWHLYMQQPQLNGQDQTQLGPPIPCCHPSRPLPTLETPTIEIVKPVKLNFVTILDVFNPLKIPNKQGERSESTSSNSTIEIPRSHPPPGYYYWSPEPTRASQFPYTGFSIPPAPPVASASAKSRPHLDGHNHSSDSDEEGESRRKLEKKKKPVEMDTYLRHYCAKCGRPRSRRYQRENPVKKGVIPTAKICSRCLPPTIEKSNLKDAPRHGGSVKSNPVERNRSRGNEEVEEILIRRGRGRPSFAGGQPSTTETVRVSRRRESSSFNEKSIKKRDSSGSSEHYQRVRIIKEDYVQGRDQPVRQIAGTSDRKSIVYRYKFVDNASPEKQSSKLQKKQQDDVNQSIEPDPPREPSPPTERHTIYRYRLAERPNMEDSRKAYRPIDEVKYHASAVAEESSRERERSPLRPRLRCRSSLGLQDDEKVQWHDRGYQQNQSKPHTNARAPQDSDKKIYRVHLYDDESCPSAQHEHPGSVPKPRDRSPPEWYYRHYQRYSIPVDRLATIAPDERQKGSAPHDMQSKLVSRRRSPSSDDMPRKPMRTIADSHSRVKSQYKQQNKTEHRSRSRRYVSESSGSDNDEEPRSRVQFVAGTKSSGTGRGVPCTRNDGELALERQREAVRDWQQAKDDHHNLNRVKSIVRHAADKGGGAFELDGHQSEEIERVPELDQDIFGGIEGGRAIPETVLGLMINSARPVSHYPVQSTDSALGTSTFTAHEPYLKKWQTSQRRKNKTSTVRIASFFTPSSFADDPVDPSSSPTLHQTSVEDHILIGFNQLQTPSSSVASERHSAMGKPSRSHTSLSIPIDISSVVSPCLQDSPNLNLKFSPARANSLPTWMPEHLESHRSVKVSPSSPNMMQSFDMNSGMKNAQSTAIPACQIFEAPSSKLSALITSSNCANERRVMSDLSEVTSMPERDSFS